MINLSATESNCEGPNAQSQSGRHSIESATFTPATLKQKPNGELKQLSNASGQNHGLKMEARESLMELQNFTDVVPKQAQMEVAMLTTKRKKISLELTEKNANKLQKQPEDGWVSASGASDANYANARTMV